MSKNDLNKPHLFIDNRCVFTSVTPIVSKSLSLAEIDVSPSHSTYAVTRYYPVGLFKLLSYRYNCHLLLDNPGNGAGRSLIPHKVLVNEVKQETVETIDPSWDFMPVLKFDTVSTMNIIEEFMKYQSNPQVVIVTPISHSAVGGFIDHIRNSGGAARGIITGMSEGLCHEDLNVLNSFVENPDKWGKNYKGSNTPPMQMGTDDFKDYYGYNSF